MSSTKDEVVQTVRSFLLDQVLQGADPEELDATTPLVSGRILDSISILQLVAVLEQRFGIEIEPHELTEDHFETVESIADLVTAKAA